MIEALWSVAFSTPQGAAGTGVVVLESQKILGGDAMYYYVGDYVVTHGQSISGKVEVIHYAGPPWNIFGPIERLTLEFTGQISGNTVQTVGVDPSNHQRQVSMTFRRLADLP